MSTPSISPRLASRVGILGTEERHDAPDDEKTEEEQPKTRSSSSSSAKGATTPPIYNFVGSGSSSTCTTTGSPAATHKTAVPKFILDAAEYHLYMGHNSMPPPAGVPSTRLTIADFANRTYPNLNLDTDDDKSQPKSPPSSLSSPRARPEYTPDNVLITSQSVLFQFLLCTINPGDVVAYPSPGKCHYENAIRLSGGIPRPYFYRISRDDGRTRTTNNYNSNHNNNSNGKHNKRQAGAASPSFVLDVTSIRNAIEGTVERNDTQRGLKPARCLIWNDAHNPSGCRATLDQLRQVADIVAARDDQGGHVWVLDDRSESSDVGIVPDLPRDGSGHNMHSRRSGGLNDVQSIVQLDQMRSRTVLLLPSWNISAAVGPQSIIDAMTQLHSSNLLGGDSHLPPRFVQLAAETAFRADNAGRMVRHATEVRSELSRRRGLLVSLLVGSCGGNGNCGGNGGMGRGVPGFGGYGPEGNVRHGVRMIAPRGAPFVWVDVTAALGMLGILEGEEDVFQPGQRAAETADIVRDNERALQNLIRNETCVAFAVRTDFGPLPPPPPADDGDEEEEERRRYYVRMDISAMGEDDIRAGVAALKQFMKERDQTKKNLGVVLEEEEEEEHGEEDLASHLSQ